MKDALKGMLLGFGCVSFALGNSLGGALALIAFVALYFGDRDA